MPASNNVQREGSCVSMQPINAKVSRRSSWVLILIVGAPMAVNALAGFLLGTMQGDLRPAASDAEILRWQVARIMQLAGLVALGLGVAAGILGAFRLEEGTRLRRVLFLVALTVGLSALAFFVAWLVGLNFFALPTTL